MTINKRLENILLILQLLFLYLPCFSGRPRRRKDHWEIISNTPWKIIMTGNVLGKSEQK